jgi:hypothetical protein
LKIPELGDLGGLGESYFFSYLCNSGGKILLHVSVSTSLPL